jgi:hypothetical protein
MALDFKKKWSGLANYKNNSINLFTLLTQTVLPMENSVKFNPVKRKRGLYLFSGSVNYSKYKKLSTLNYFIILI